MSCKSKSLRIIGGLLAAALALVLTACSVVRLGYSQLPDLAYWWIDSYLDLNDAQSAPLRGDLSRLYDWHRQTELPLLANALASLQAQASQDTSPQRLCQRIEVFKPRLQAILNQAIPGFSALAERLRPEQLDHLQHQLEKRQQDWRKEWQTGTRAEQLERRSERLIERSERFYGRLDPAQRAQLRTSVQASRFDPALAEAEMLRRHQDLLQTLKALAQSGLSAPRINADIEQLLGRMMNSPNPAYRAHMDTVQQENCQTFASLHNSSTAAQRQKLALTLAGFEADARALIPAKP